MQENQNPQDLTHKYKMFIKDSILFSLKPIPKGEIPLMFQRIKKNKRFIKYKLITLHYITL